MSDIARIDSEPMVLLTPDTVKTLTARPMLAVPPSLRPAVFQAWAVFRHLAGFDTPAPIAFAASVWVNQHRVDPGKVAEALAAVTHPRHMRTIKFASDFTAAVADMLTPPETPAEWAARIRAKSPAFRETTGGAE